MFNRNDVDILVFFPVILKLLGRVGVNEDGKPCNCIGRTNNLAEAVSNLQKFLEALERELEEGGPGLIVRDNC